MYRVVIRNLLNADEVRPYKERDLGSDRNTVRDVGLSAKFYPEILPEPLDILELGPILQLKAAQDKAEQIIAEARAKTREIEEEAFAKGFARGREEGKQEVLPALIAFADAGQALIVFEERLISSQASQLVRLALEIAEKVIGRAVKENPTIVANIIERARHEVTDAKQIRIWLHPEDLIVLTELRPDLIRVGDEHGRKIEVVPSDEIGRGGCRVETEIGLVDATIPTQIQEIRRQLLDEESLNAPGNAPFLTGGSEAVPSDLDL